jgi:hypothetical protein
MVEALLNFLPLVIDELDTPTHFGIVPILPSSILRRAVSKISPPLRPRQEPFYAGNANGKDFRRDEDSVLQKMSWHTRKSAQGSMSTCRWPSDRDSTGNGFFMVIRRVAL